MKGSTFQSSDLMAANGENRDLCARQISLKDSGKFTLKVGDGCVSVWQPYDVNQTHFHRL